jgi:hypothetical protein
VNSVSVEQKSIIFIPRNIISLQQITNTIERNMNKVSLLLLWMMLGNVLSLQAQIRGNSIEVKVVPDHQDWRYEVGETATFKISVTHSNTLLYNIKVDYAAGPEMYQNV